MCTRAPLGLLLLFAACASAAPGVERVNPSGGAPGTLVEISGNGFRDGLEARLGARPLDQLEHVDARRMRGRVPQGLPPGEHDLVLAEGGEVLARIPRAFAVAGRPGDAAPSPAPSP